MYVPYITLHYKILLLPVCTLTSSTPILISNELTTPSTASPLLAFRPSLAVTPSLLSSSSVRLEKYKSQRERRRKRGKDRKVVMGCRGEMREGRRRKDKGWEKRRKERH